MVGEFLASISFLGVLLLSALLINRRLIRRDFRPFGEILKDWRSGR